MEPRPTVDRRLQQLASAFTPEWLAAQRWYRAKTRRLAGVELFDAAEVDGSPGWLLVLEAAEVAGGLARYLVPVTLDGDTHSAAMLQQLVHSEGDGWSWMLDQLAARPDGPDEAIRGVAQIGRLTAGMHAALASRPAAPGFPSRLATRDELSTWGSSAELQLGAALNVLGAADRPRMAALAPRIKAGFVAIKEAKPARVSRTHGDYHLGQLLRSQGAFTVLDFEGEPARTLAERRAPASPLRDLAGMLRSLDYAAHTAIADDRAPSEDSGWLAAARAALVEGYGGVLPDEAPLLAAFELEKACYEVVYEANNRPDWTWLPLGALERLTLG